MLSTCYQLAINYFMANHLAGVGATILGTSHAAPDGPASKERYAFGVLAALEQEENTLARLPDRTDRITITVNLSTKTADINLLLNVVATNAAGGITTYTATHYLLGSTFISGTGGNNSPPNLAQAAMEAVMELKLIELDSARRLQPSKTVITDCTHTVGSSGGSNATFSALLKFPVEIISLPGGGSLVEGKIFLS